MALIKFGFTAPLHPLRSDRVGFCGLAYFIFLSTKTYYKPKLIGIDGDIQFRKFSLGMVTNGDGTDFSEWEIIKISNNFSLRGFNGSLHYSGRAEC